MARLFIHKDYIEIRIENEEDRAAAAQIPYIHVNRSRTVCKTSLLNINLVLQLFRDITVDTLADKTPILPAIKKLQQYYETKQLIKNGPNHKHEWLMPHQQLACEIAAINPRYAFFYDTRTGKTPMSLQIIVDDIKENPNNKWLVVCPLILIENAWLDDLKKFFPGINAVKLHANTKAKRLKAFKEKANIYIINTESFCSYLPEIEKLNIHGAFLDESSSMKSHKSKFSKAAVEYSKRLKRWYLLSGTPAPNGEWEYYSQLQSVDLYGVHQSYTRFKEYFFNNVSFNSQYEKLVAKHERRQEMLDILSNYSMYVDKEDVLETPGREFKEVTLHMPDQLKDAYDKVRKELYAEVDGKRITTEGAAAAINKLNQISSGFIIDTRAKEQNKYFNAGLPELYELSDYRFNALLDLLKEIGNEQVLIWANYRYEFEVIQKLLDDKCKCIYGKTPNDEKNCAIKSFKDKFIQYLVANPASADKGLTLTNAHIAIYFSLNYSYELFKQSMERIYGGVHSQKNFCTYFIFITKGTVNQQIYSALINKQTLSVEVLEHLKGG